MNQPLQYPLCRTTRNREQMLVQRAKAGDREAFAELYDRFVDSIFKYVSYKVGSKTDAEDLTALVFLKAWEAIGRYKWTGRPFSAWLYRIAHNAIVDYYRTRREVLPLHETIANNEPCDGLEEATQRQWTAEVLQRALCQLTDAQQQVVVLRFFQDYTVEEVAQILGRQPSAVRTLQYRALSRLCQILRANPEFAALVAELQEYV